MNGTIFYKSRKSVFVRDKESIAELSEIPNFDIGTWLVADDEIDPNVEEQKSFKYYLNSKLLKSENDEDIEEVDFKNLIIGEVNKFINPFENIVVLAGAGASIVNDNSGIPDENYGHTIQMLAKAVHDTLRENSDLFTVEEMSSHCNYSISITLENPQDGDSEVKYNPEFVLEDFLSKVITYKEFLIDASIREKYEATVVKILEIIKEKTSYAFEKHKHNHSSLIKILSSLIKSPNRLSVVTSNYDTLFEEAANELNFTVFDGFSFDAKPKFDIDIFDWSLVKPILNVKSDKVEYKKSTINLLKIHGSLTWKKDDANIVRVGKEENTEAIMIFPSSNKYSHSYEKPYFELFYKFQEILKKQNTLLISTGFSFADNHIAKMVIQALKSTPSLSLLITDYSLDSDSKSENWQELEILMKEGYRVAFLKATLDTDLLDYFGKVKL